VTSDTLVLALAAVNFVLFGLAGYQLVARRPPPTGEEEVELSQAFKELDKAVRSKFPRTPPGLTWRETIAMTESLKVDVDWSKVGRALDSYEGLRYGGRKDDHQDASEVVALARRLKRGA
jgi:hypothetical protein